MYIYPDDLKGHASLFLWRMWDVVAIIIVTVISLIIYLTLKFMLPLIITGLVAFLTIRFDGTSVFDYVKYAFRFCISTKQEFFY